MFEFSSLALVDRTTFDDLIAHIGAVNAHDFVGSFFREAQGRVDALRGLGPGQSDAVRFQTHALHGSGGMFGLTRLSALLRSLHGEADAIAPDAYGRAVEALAEVLSQSRKAIDEILTARPGRLT